MSQNLCAIFGDVCIPNPFAKFPGNVCDLTTTSCPYSSGKQYTETVTLPVPKYVPDVSICNDCYVILVFLLVHDVQGMVWSQPEFTM